MARLVSTPPARTIKRSHRSLTGKVAIESGAVAFESSLERDLIILLDFDDQVIELREQPFTLEYQHDGVTHKYAPDIMAKYTNSATIETVVYEVKYRDELMKNWHTFKPRFRHAYRHCKSKGWRFRLITEREIRTPLLENARFLRRYRALTTDHLTCDQLLFSIKALGKTTPQTLLALAYWSKDSQMRAIPMLWKMIAERRLRTDLHKKLTMSSLVWMPG